MIQTKDVLRLTGLSTDQLREWTSRRGLLKPDVQPSGPGTLALYGWQTVLALRLAVTMRKSFHMELEAHRSLLEGLRHRLAATSFLGLLGFSLACFPDGEWTILRPGEHPPIDQDVVVLRLDPHLEILAAAFAPHEDMRQLPLFAALGMK